MKAETALKMAKHNKFRATAKYYKTFNEFAEVDTPPKFKLSKNNTFFTIGSCFARNVENHLIKNKIPLLSKMPNVEGRLFKSGGEARTGYQNVYTPGSVLEMSRLINSNDKYHSIVENKGLHYDLLTHGLNGLSEEECKNVRDGMLESYTKIASTDVLIVTLGYIEAWYFGPAKSWVNQSPAEPKLRSIASDFEFKVLEYEKIHSMLTVAINNFKLQNPLIKFIFTVSPVPLGSTFTDDHILVANQRSKSTLHAVAQKLSREFDEVDYFPSYEMVSLSDRKYAFMEDNMHVKSSVVASVMERFFKNYFDGTTSV